MIDSEPTVLDEMRKGKYGNLYNNNNIIDGKQDCSNLFSRGMRESREKVPEVIDKIRKLAENTDCLEGIQLFHSINGGTGSGFGS